jgi:rhamnosyltransferase
VTELIPKINTVTVAIPTCDAGCRFSELLDKLTKQTLKPDGIIVVDSASADQTGRVAEDYKCMVITINRADFDHGTTRNLAVSRTDSEFVIFLTQDAIPADEFMIAELIKPMQADPNIAVCYGRQLPASDAGRLESFARLFNYPEKSVLKTKNDIAKLGLKTFFCSNSCSAIRTSILKELGGFKNNVIVNEDMLFAAQAILAGFSVYYSADAKVFHSHRFSATATFRRYFNIGRFFADNRWITDIAGISRFGSDYVRAGIRHFRETRRPLYIAVLFFEFVIKAAAFKFGWFYQRALCKKCDWFVS